MKKNIILVIVLLLIFIIPFFINHGGDYSGSDSQAETVILSIDSDYQSWIGSVYEPTSEIETLLFSLQAAFGTGIICYILGYYQGRRHKI